ncbi:MAG: hypothetical protein Q8N04_01190 [Nitrospira sp.]|nr:hypothetical protein [Nitrospira sp.]
MSCCMCDPSGSPNLIGMARPYSRYLFFSAVLLLALMSLPGRALAEWSAIAETKVLYTDNVFELSSSRRLALAEDPSQPAVVSVKKAGDVVWEPSIDLRHRSRPTNLGDMEVSLKAAGFVFTDNPIFNHGNYRIQVKQALDADTSILIRYRFVPNLFLGPNTERRTGLRLPEEERVTSHIWRVQVERRLSESLIGTLVARYGLRQFNDVFAERDTAFWSAGPQVEWLVMSRVTLSLAYLFEQGLADGREQTQFRDDVSYRQHFTSIGATVQIAEPLSFMVGYAYRRKEFTSEIAGDSNRGVVDTTHQGSAEFQYRLSPAAIMTLGVQRSQRLSNVTSREFFNTNTSLGIQYRF